MVTNNILYRQMASSMNVHEDPADIVGSPKNIKLIYKLFKDTLNFFSPENGVIAIGSSNFKVAKTPQMFRDVRNNVQISDNATLPLPELEYFEKRYSTPFTVYEVPPTMFRYWKSSDNNEELYLPNITTFTLRKEDFPTFSDSDINIRKLIGSSEVTTMEVWILPHVTGKYPKVKVQCRILSALINENERSAGKFQICSQTEQLFELNYRVCIRLIYTFV